MNHWNVTSEEMPELAREGDRIIYVLVVDDLECVYFDLWNTGEVSGEWDELSEEERERLFNAVHKTCDGIDWLPIFQEAIKEEMRNAERDG